jgi:hypothetical protein
MKQLQVKQTGVQANTLQVPTLACRHNRRLSRAQKTLKESLPRHLRGMVVPQSELSKHTWPKVCSATVQRSTGSVRIQAVPPATDTSVQPLVSGNSKARGYKEIELYLQVATFSVGRVLEQLPCAKADICRALCMVKRSGCGEVKRCIHRCRGNSNTALLTL